MTYAPDDLADALAELHAQGAPWESLGIVGDAAHLATGGYHVGRDDLAARGRLGYDYSVVESKRDARPTDAASAIDFAGAAWWRDLTLWLVDACRAGAPGTEDVREIIYTPDGVTVQRWDRLGVRTTGDSSHLWHTHISFHRDAEGRRSTFVALLQRFFTGQPATPPASTIEEDQMWSTGPRTIPPARVVTEPDGTTRYVFDQHDNASIPPVGYATPGRGHIELCNDTGLDLPAGQSTKYRVRLAWPTDRGWHIEELTLDNGQGGWSSELPSLCRGVSVKRLPVNEHDTGQVPLTYTVTVSPRYPG